MTTIENQHLILGWLWVSSKKTKNNFQHFSVQRNFTVLTWQQSADLKLTSTRAVPSGAQLRSKPRRSFCSICCSSLSGAFLEFHSSLRTLSRLSTDNNWTITITVFSELHHKTFGEKTEKTFYWLLRSLHVVEHHVRWTAFKPQL